MKCGGRRLVALVLGLSVAIGGGSGCVSVTHVNQPLAQYDPDAGYRPRHPQQRRAPGRTILFLAFSGGGTRAAALAYGVMEELRGTEVRVDGKRVSLLSEIDSISGVSGGTFPASYYALFGDRIFDDFERRFLKKNVQRALFLRMLPPWTLLKLMTPFLDRSDIAARYYDRHIFDGATFSDLRVATGPRVYINATDLTSGERFTFTQDTFDLICSEIDAMPVATAVAASSAVPVFLAPVTLQNFAGRCNFQPPQWIEAALHSPNPPARVKRGLAAYRAMLDQDQKPYLHLVDGSVADNLGLRSAVDFITAAGGPQNVRRITGLAVPDRMVIISVNAETDSDPTIDLSNAAPSLALLLNTVAGSQIRRANFETLLLTEELLHRWGRELSSESQTVQTHFVSLGFNDLADVDERKRLNRLPTSFRLNEDDVDSLRAAGRRLLRDSPQFQALVAEMQ
ncbi:MAG: patatin-like phospholipase family protein [Deltaproteobacteria bacterium]|nr:patatin-like phospholipase family protein [Deltaproteobacteria bacterium]MBW2665544.1 patatin-like phospholipase family protein [Deltaproteobacteria bacterium]